MTGVARQHRTAARAVTRGAAALIVAAAVSLAMTACSTDPSEPSAGSPPIPTFPGPGAAPTVDAPPPRDSILPTDCNQIIDAEALPNLLGLPLQSAQVSALRDVPAPQVGRLERVTCNYTSTGGSGAPSSGTQLLRILTSGYTDADSAAAQAQVNREAQASSGVTGEQVPLGGAQAQYFADPDGPALTVVYGRVTASFTLAPGQPIPVGQARAVLVDLAQRALPVLVPPTS